MSGWLIYFITRLDSLQYVICIPLTVVVAGFCVACIAWLLSWNDGNDKMMETFKALSYKLVPIIIALVILLALIPSTKEMVAIYLIPKIVNNEQVQKFPNNALELLNIELQHWIKDTVLSESDTKDSD